MKRTIVVSIFLSFSICFYGQSDPNNYLKSAKEKYSNKDYKGAIRDYKKLLKTSNGIDTVYFQIAGCYVRLNDNEKAIQNYNKAIEINPKYIYAFYYRGKAKKVLRDYPGAIADFNEVLNLSNGTGAYEFTLSSIYISRADCKLKINQRAAACEDLQVAFSMGDNAALELMDKYCK